MSNYQIISDSCSNLPIEEIKKHDIAIIPMYWIDENGEEHISFDINNQPDLKKFYDKMRQGAVIKTSAINETSFIEFFEQFLKKGLDVLYIAFSSALSTTYSSACVARDVVLKKYPERKVIVIDSLSASTGQGLLVYYAALNKENNMSLEENASWVEDHKLNLAHYFTVDDLKYLFRGGRVSKTSFILGSALRIKPILHVNDEGKLVPFAKVIGRKKSIQVMANELLKHAKDLKNQTIAISHGDCKEDVDYLISLIESKTKVKKIIVNYIDQTIGAHSGPGTLALFALCDTRHPD